MVSDNGGNSILAQRKLFIRVIQMMYFQCRIGGAQGARAVGQGVAYSVYVAGKR
ncbi:hypothetical protein PSCICN_13940 [Pseudomonas cichorii]|nr:hypothetical protein PSCICN_13940 [Pseudomonas cichorii]